MSLVSCRRHGVGSLVLLVAAALALGTAGRAQTTIDQLAWMSKADLPRVFAVVDHAVADFDRDGDLDIVAVSASSPPGNVLLYNTGRGVFQVVNLQTAWDSYTCVAAGDVDGDGKLDLVTGGAIPNPYNQGSTRLFRGRGNGLFDDATASNLPADVEFTRDIALGDVDGDGDLDVVLGQTPWQTAPGQTRLYLNDGKGRFTDVTASSMPVDNDDTWSIALGDVDGDRDLDLVLGNSSFGVPKVTNRLYLNDGRGRFAEATTGRLMATQDATFAVLLADLDRDGDLDLVEANSGQSRLHANDGRGFFAPPVVSLPLADLDTRSVAAGDLDADGDLDLYLGNTVDQDRIYLNDGRGRFADASGGLPGESGDGKAVSLADLDGDGDLDVFALSGNGPPDSDVLWNAGGLRFASAHELMGPAHWDLGRMVGVADLNGDGDVDLVVATPGRRGAWLAFGQGDGRFRDATGTHAPAGQFAAQSVAIADVDGDGDPDVAFGGLGQRSVLWLNDGRGRFTDASGNLPATTPSTRMLAFGDVDVDGDPDLVLANHGVQNQLWLNTGGVFRDVSVTFPRDADASQDVVMADVDGDRDLDLVFANGDMYQSLAQRNTLYLGNGRGGFTASALTAVVDISLGVAAGDVDRDGDVDLYFANVGGPFVPAPDELYLNDGAGRFTRAPASALPPPTATTDVALGDLDDNGTLDLVSMSLPDRPTIALGDGQGRFVPAPRGGWLASTTFCTLADVDGDGDLDLFTGGSLAINRHRQAFASSVARAGGTWMLEVWAEPAYGKAQIPVLPMIGLNGLDPGVTIPPYGRLRLDPRSAIVLPVVAFWNFHTWRLPIPNEQALLGRTLFAQALVFHGSGLGSARLTNRFGDVVFR